MKSTIKVDFTSSHPGAGLEPVIVVNKSKDSSDPRDKLLSAFFEQLGHSSKWLYVHFYEDNRENSVIHLLPVRPSDNLRHIADMAICDMRPMSITNDMRPPNRIDLLPPSEKAIHDAIWEIEKLPGHPILTDLQVILSFIQGVLYDYNMSQKTILKVDEPKVREYKMTEIKRLAIKNQIVGESVYQTDGQQGEYTFTYNGWIYGFSKKAVAK